MADAQSREPLFREIEHTADLGIEVEAETLPEVFRRAGLALFALMVDPDGVEAREERRIAVPQAGDVAEVLRDWLAACLRLFLREGFVACEIEVVKAGPEGVDSRLRGEKLDQGRHRFLTEVKAVTWHGLRLEREGDRWRGRVIFDV
jgi:SHS2 domain-containing protein